MGVQEKATGELTTHCINPVSTSAPAACQFGHVSLGGCPSACSPAGMTTLYPRPPSSPSLKYRLSHRYMTPGGPEAQPYTATCPLYLLWVIAHPQTAAPHHQQTSCNAKAGESVQELGVQRSPTAVLLGAPLLQATALTKLKNHHSLLLLFPQGSFPDLLI